MLALALPATPRVAVPPSAVDGRGRAGRRRGWPSTRWSAHRPGRPGTPAPSGPARRRSARPPRRRRRRRSPGRRGLLGERSSSVDGGREVGDDEQRPVEALAELVRLHLVGLVRRPTRRLGRAVGQPQPHLGAGTARTAARRRRARARQHASGSSSGGRRRCSRRRAGPAVARRPGGRARVARGCAARRGEDGRGEGDGDEDRDEHGHGGRRCPSGRGTGCP